MFKKAKLSKKIANTEIRLLNNETVNYNMLERNKKLF